MKTFFKWSGGKSRELKKITPMMPASWDTYYEPFVGGGALWLKLEPNKSVVNDSFEEVANFYNVLKQEPQKLIDHLNDIATEYNKIDKDPKKLSKEEFQKVADEYYYAYRNTKPDNSFDRAVRFYILRQFSFSGMLRFSKEGKFNVPFGWYKKLKKLEQPIETIKSVFNNTKILNADWKDVVKEAKKNDFVFLDPPYTRKFQKYHPNGEFGQEQHIELADWFKAKQSQAMIIINIDEFTTSLYKDFIVESYDHQYSIQYRDRMTKEDSNAKHLLAINY